MAATETGMWDSLGLPRETRVNGQSWNPNGISIFFHQLSFQDYIYWDAIYWRTGYLDRQVGEYRDRFVAELDQRFHVETLEDRNERARILAQYSDQKSLWYQCARFFGMRDHMIIVFETSRTRPIESVDLPNKHEIRRKYHSSDPREKMEGQIALAAWTLGNGRVSAADIEAVIGRPHYELWDLPVSECRPEIDSSVAAATADITNEATRLMKTLHVRPYAFWVSETELMIAAARPGIASGPWTRQELEQQAPLLVSDADGVMRRIPDNLREQSNRFRVAYEPGQSWNKITEADAKLVRWLDRFPDYRDLLESEEYTDDDSELLHRLIRLSRFGYCYADVVGDWVFHYPDD